MRAYITLVAVTGLLSFSACDSKKVEETTTTNTVEETSINATDIAETTASPIDTLGVLSDSATTIDSIR